MSQGPKPVPSGSVESVRPIRGRLLAPARESELRARLCARDERALSELVDVATPWLMGLVQGMLRDPDEAEDVVIETFRLAWAGIKPATEDGTPLVPWLARIARNRAIDRIRADRRRRVRQGVVQRDTDDRTAAVEPDEAATPGWHVHGEVHRALAALPPDQGTVIRLAYFEGLTHSEIAERLDTPLGTVKTRLRLAVSKLRGTLAALEGWTR